MIQVLTNQKFIWLGLVLLIAVILRTLFFNQSPPSLNWDEASLGYNAYSILKTGKDEWGRAMPVTFEAFGDYKLPGYIYTAVPFIALLGLNELAVRLPSVIAGVVAVLFLYLLVLKLSGNKLWAFVSSLVLAISPWAVFLSRIALEANLALCFFILAVFFLVKGRERLKLLSVSSLFFGLTLFTYNSARVFVPLFLLSLAIFNFKKIIPIRKKLILPALIFLIFIGLAGFLAITQDSASRYYWVAIVDEGAINSINQSRGESTLGPILTKLVHNRVSYFIFHFSTNYLSHFSPKFLFLEGGSNYQFSVPNYGLMYFIELPFLLLGIYRILKRKSWAILFLSWILLAPIPAAITRESPHVLRSIFMLGALQVLVGFGFVAAFELLKRKLTNVRFLFAGVVFILIITQAGIYFNNYFFNYPIQYSQSWQYGYKQAYEFILSKENLNERPLYISKRYGEPHIFYLFYSKYDPAKYQTNPNLTRYSKTNWRWVDRIDNVYFINDWEMKERLKDQHGFVITTQENYVGIPPILSRIYFLDAKTAFEIVEI
jgi:4-amino-4-deoxy-L-arabinose transferase-like glycosyltransferase